MWLYNLVKPKESSDRTDAQRSFHCYICRFSLPNSDLSFLFLGPISHAIIATPMLNGILYFQPINDYTLHLCNIHYGVAEKPELNAIAEKSLRHSCSQWLICQHRRLMVLHLAAIYVQILIIQTPCLRSQLQKIVGPNSVRLSFGEQEETLEDYCATHTLPTI